jgi:hypothetical protein
MNGHAQSGGHWNTAFRLMGSVGLGTPQESSRSGDGLAKNILVIIGCDRDTAWRSPTQWLRHKTGTGKTTNIPFSLNQRTTLLYLGIVHNCSEFEIKGVASPFGNEVTNAEAVALTSEGSLAIYRNENSTVPKTQSERVTAIIIPPEGRFPP